MDAEKLTRIKMVFQGGAIHRMILVIALSYKRKVTKSLTVTTISILTTRNPSYQRYKTRQNFEIQRQNVLYKS